MTSERHDPYWSSGMWTDGSSLAWSTGQRVEPGYRLVGRHVVRADAHKRLLADANRDHQVHLLAVLNMWHCLTTQQLAAITGATERTTLARLIELFDARIIDVGRVNAFQRADMLAQPMAWRINTDGLRRILRRHRVTADERYSIDCGLAIDGRQQYDRHNVLTAEFAQRCVEAGLLAYALGERVGGAEMMFPLPVRHTEPDAVLVRPDGFRIAIELTASRDVHERKVTNWLTNLAANPAEGAGIAVVFLIACRPDDPHRSSPRTLLRQHYPAQLDALRRSVSASAQSRQTATERIFFASWDSYFPGAKTKNAVYDPTAPATEAFSRLRATRLLDDAEIDLVDLVGGGIADAPGVGALRDQRLLIQALLAA